MSKSERLAVQARRGYLLVLCLLGVLATSWAVASLFLPGATRGRNDFIAFWRTAQIHQAILATFGLASDAYTLTQLRYDLRKMKAHGLLERDGRRYLYRLSDKGAKVALLFTLFHKSPTPCSVTTPTNRRSRTPKSKPHITGLIAQSRTCLICSPLEEI